MLWQETVKPHVLDWLLDDHTPSVRYLTLRDLLDYPLDESDLVKAHQDAHATGAIATILDHMKPDGYWMKAGAGYSGKYKSTVWSIILLAQLGASITLDPRIEQACENLLNHALTENGQFGTEGTSATNVDCLQGNLCAAMLDLGVTDPRLTKALVWMAQSVTGEGVAPAWQDTQGSLQYSTDHNSGSHFRCGWNNHNACAWGAIKVALAFSKLPVERRTPLMQRAIKATVEFLLSRDPALADYPTPKEDKPSRKWWKFGFPVFYVTDLLQNVEALVALGYGHAPRLSNAIEIIQNKQDEDGCWALDNTYKTWVSFGDVKQSNKWVTLRALRVLKAVAS